MASDPQEIQEGCDGSCISVNLWCCECDQCTRHVMVGEFVAECQECFEPRLTAADAAKGDDHASGDND